MLDRERHIACVLDHDLIENVFGKISKGHK